MNAHFVPRGSIHFLLSFIALPLLFAGSASRAAETTNWSYEWTADNLPQQTAKIWLVHNQGNVLLNEGVMVVESPLIGGVIWSTTDKTAEGRWDGSKPLTVEFEARAAKLADGARAAGEMGISDGNSRYIINITAPEFHLYRLTLKEGSTQLFIDGDAAPQSLKRVKLKAEDHFPNAIYFGDGSNGVGGVSEWKSLRWTFEE